MALAIDSETQNMKVTQIGSGSPCMSNVTLQRVRARKHIRLVLV